MRRLDVDGPIADAPTEPPATVRRAKDYDVESLRGLAILLMVAGHVIGSYPDRGMQVPDGSGWRVYYETFADVRMPLFTLLSGFVYAYRPLRAVAGYRAMITGKARRLLVPLVTVGTVYFVVQLIVPGTNSKPHVSQFWRIFVFGFEHLWFLQALFLIFLLVGLLDAFRRMETLGAWAMVAGLSVAAYVALAAPRGWNVFSVNSALRLLPFFLLGYGLHRFADELDSTRRLFLALPVFVVALAVRLAVVLGALTVTGYADRVLSVVLGTSAVVAVFVARRWLYLRPLAWLGQFAFGVYLLHVFGSAGSRMALERLGGDSHAVVFLVGMVVAVGLPVLFEIAFGRRRVVSWAVLGQRPRVRLTSPPRRADRAARDESLTTVRVPG